MMMTTVQWNSIPIRSHLYQTQHLHTNKIYFTITFKEQYSMYNMFSRLRLWMKERMGLAVSCQWEICVSTNRKRTHVLDVFLRSCHSLNKRTNVFRRFGNHPREKSVLLACTVYNSRLNHKLHPLRYCIIHANCIVLLNSF